MPSYGDYVQVATQLEERLGQTKRQFISLPRGEITNILRGVSSEKTSRIKRQTGATLDKAFLEKGLRAFPTIEDTSTDAIIRIFRTNSVVAAILDILLYPNDKADKKLRSIVNLDGLRDLLRE
ncbi:MAG: hypothetical protein Q7O66_12675 [Dehalococcoidia bacterium]|nr:hypothetical protein [Dehalococcoidia bacterium]